MRSTETDQVPHELHETRQRFEAWRSNRPQRGGRIPEALWAAAVAAAQQHGVYRTARTLRLDYTVLKRRLRPPRGRRANAPTFVELPAPARTAANPACTIELDVPRGGRLRMTLDRVSGADLVAMLRVVSGRGRR